MATITTRVQGDSPKGSPLTNAEVDNNFINLNTAKYESGDSPTFGDITATKATVELLLDATNNGSGAHVSRLEVNSFPARGSHIYLTDNDGRLFGIARDYVSGSALTRVKFKVSDGTTEVNAFDVTQAGLMTINEDGADLDFRVESDTNTHMLFVDAGKNQVIFGGSGGPAVNASSDRTYDAVAANGIAIGNGTYTHGYVGTAGTAGDVLIASNAYPANVGSSRSIRLSGGTSGGGFASMAVFNPENGAVWNEDGYSGQDFRIESDTNSHMLFVDAGVNSVSIGTSTTHNDVPLTVDNAGNALKARIGVLSTTNNGVDSLFRFQTKTVGGTQNLYGDIGLDATNEALIFNDPGYSSSSIGQRPMRLLSDGSLNVGGPIVLGAGQESLDTDSSGSVSSADAVNYVKWANRTVTSTFNSGIAIQAPWTAVSGTNWTNNKFRFHLWRSHSNDVLAAAVGSSSRSGDGDSFVLGNTNIASGAERVTTGLAVDGRDMYLYGQYKLSLQAYNEVTVNDLSEDVDFRVESNGNSNMLFVDGTSDAVGIGAVPSYTFDVSGTGRFTDLLRVDEPIYSYSTSGTKHYTHIATGSLYNAQGVVILTTNIPGHNQSGNANMFAIRISGYAYNSKGPVDFWVGCYAGENNYYSYYISGEMPPEWHEKAWVYTDANGKVAFQFGDSTTQLQNTEVAVAEFVQGFANVNASYAKGWTISTATSIPATQTQKTLLLPYSKHNGYLYSSHGAVFNDLSLDSDFRVESSSNTHMLFVNAGENKISIGASNNYGATLNIAGNTVNNVYHHNWTDKTISWRSANDGTYKGYLLLVEAHPGSGTVTKSLVEGRIRATRGGTGSGNSNGYVEIYAATAYNNDTAGMRGYGNSAANQYFTALRYVTVTATGKRYIAIETTNTGGQPDNGILFTGTIGGRAITDSGTLTMVYDTEVSNVATCNKAPFNHTNASESTFNEQGGDFDFRVESNNNSSMLLVDAGNDRVGIGRSPSYGVHAQLSDGTITVEGPSGSVMPRFYAKWKDADAGLSMGYEPGYAVSYIDNTYPRTQGTVYGDISIRTKDSGSQVERLRVIADKVGGYNVQVTQTGLRVGRTVYNWFQYGQNPGTGNRYLHMKTTLWSGTGPNNTQPTMSLFHIKGYTYDARTIDTKIGFHNWSGGYYNLRITDSGSWPAGVSPYTSSDGYVVLVLDLGTNYPGISIDWHQSFEYGYQNKQVSAYSASSSSSGVY